MAFVFDILPDEFLGQHLSKLRFLVQDPSLPQNIVKTSVGRNSQAEFYTAAICWKAGLHPVLFDEPDVRCQFKGQTFGLAVKRLKKNRDRLRDRVREAALQIQRSGLPGLVVLDTALVGNPDNNRFWTPVADEVFKASYKIAMNAFITHEWEGFCDLVRGKGVRGIIMMDSQIRQNSKYGWELSGMNVGIPTELDNELEADEFESIWSAIQCGIPNLAE